MAFLRVSIISISQTSRNKGLLWTLARVRRIQYVNNVHKNSVAPTVKRISQSEEVSSHNLLSVGMREQGSPRIEDTLGQLEAFVRANLGRSYSLAQLARQARVSPRELNHAFIQVQGMSPSQWLKGVRLEAARQMLLDERNVQSIKDIASLTGFSSPSAFSHSYFCHFGQLPSEARRGRKGGA